MQRWCVRTEWRRYYPPFLGAIKAEVGSIMCSYNRINGNYSCGNNETLATDYKARAGFEGWVMRCRLNFVSSTSMETECHFTAAKVTVLL